MRIGALTVPGIRELATSTILATALSSGACVTEANNSPSLRGARSSRDGDDPVDSGVTTDGSSKPPPKPVPGLHAEYFDGYRDKLVERIEPNLDHDWKADPPAAGIGKDRFSVRWTGTLTPIVTGATTITIDADDGTRVWIDGKLVIDDWHAHFTERHSADVELTKDQPVSLRVDYFEADLDASARLSWAAGAKLPKQIIPGDRFMTTNQPSGLAGPKPPFANPVMPFDCPDPGVLGVGDEFYAACTGGSLPIRSSRDLVTWNDVANSAILPSGKPAWAANGNRNWAPELHRADKTFLAYYTSVNGSDVLSVGVASAPSPTGPWTDNGAPLVEHPQGVIDATFFEDDDGSRWLFYKIDGNASGNPTPIFARRLASDGLSFAPGSTATQVLTNASSTWEGAVIEAPWVVKRDARYYLFYSGNVYDQHYRTGVARATSVTGPWEKKGSPILGNNATWVGPGHGSVVRVNELDYFVYHAWHNAGDGTTGGGGRQVLVDRITWSDGWPSIANGSPSSGAQPWPGEPF
ncbi:MAG TPA: family 43 glycosylhydrolase [Labilithrix sp.]|nr:family 43 glycosylhydrolase [Labilithrix sp.]